MATKKWQMAAHNATALSSCDYWTPFDVRRDVVIKWEAPVTISYDAMGKAFGMVTLGTNDNGVPGRCAVRKDRAGVCPCGTTYHPVALLPHGGTDGKSGSGSVPVVYDVLYACPRCHPNMPVLCQTNRALAAP